VPFLHFDQEIRTVICTTNAIKSTNARLRRAVNARGHFPSVTYLADGGRLRPKSSADHTT
jgi:transposase-like protein